MSQQNATGFQVGANINPFEAAMRRMVDAARTGQSGVGSALGGIANPVQGIKAAFQGLAGVLAVGFFKNTLDETARMTEQSMDLARALGISTNEARATQIALADIGAGEGEFEGAAKGMVRQLKENEDEMNKMGLATRDAAGNLRPLNELVADGIKVMGGYKEGTDRALAGQTLFGRGIDASSKLMLFNQELMEDSRRTMEEMGLTVGENGVAAWQAYDGAMDKAGFAVQGMKKAIGDALMPVATALVNMFNAVMPAAIVVVRGALAGLAAGFLFVKNGVVVLWETINAFIFSVIEPIRGLSEMLWKAMTGDFSGAVAAFHSIGKNVGDVWAGAMERMTEESRQTAEQVYHLFARDEKTGSGGGPGAGARGYRNTKEDGKDTAVMPTYEAALNARRLAFEREDGLRQFSKEQELAYWRDILATYAVGSKDRTDIANKMGKLELDILRQNAKEKRAIDQIRAEDYKAETLAYIDELDARAAYERDQGALNQQDYLAKRQVFNQQRLQAELDFIQQKIAVAQLDPENNLVALEQLEAQKAEIRRRYGAAESDLARQKATEDGRILGNISNSIGQGFSQAANSILTSWKTAGAALRGIMTSIGQSIIQEAVIKPQAARVAAWVKERSMTQASIGADAAKASAGAAASQASIPIVGPAMAMAAMAAMFVAVSAMSGKVPSASRGFDVPAGINPLTQLHEQEMVLPAKHANVIRGLADGGQGESGQGAGALEVKVSKLHGDFFAIHRDEFLKMLKTAKRDFAF